MSKVETYETLLEARKEFGELWAANALTYAGTPTLKVASKSANEVTAHDLVIPYGVFSYNNKFHTILSAFDFGDFSSLAFDPAGFTQDELESQVKEHWARLNEQFDFEGEGLQAIPRYWTTTGEIGYGMPLEDGGRIISLTDCNLRSLPDLLNT